MKKLRWENLEWYPGDPEPEELDPYEERRERRVNRDRWNAARLDAGFRLLGEHDEDGTN